MKKLVFIIAVASICPLAFADYGAMGTVNSVKDIGVMDDSYQGYSNVSRDGARMNRRMERMNSYPYYNNGYYTQPVRTVSPVRAVAEDAVMGAETIVEAPLNLIP